MRRIAAFTITPPHRRTGPFRQSFTPIPLRNARLTQCPERARSGRLVTKQEWRVYAIDAFTSDARLLARTAP